MWLTNKIHRGTSIAAAVCLIVTLLIAIGGNIISFITLSRNPETSALVITMVNAGMNALMTVLLIVIMLRGKKDKATGILLVITVLPVVWNTIGNVSSFFTYFAMKKQLGRMFASYLLSNVIRLIANVANVGFRALLIVECFNLGKIIYSKAKFLLIILPVINIILMAGANMTQSLYALTDYGIVEYLTLTLPVAIVSIITSVGIVLVGIAFSIPVLERIPDEYVYAMQMEYNNY